MQVILMVARSSPRQVRFIATCSYSTDNFKKYDYTSFQDQEKYEHVGLKVTSTQKGKISQDDDKRLYSADDLKKLKDHTQVKLKGTSSSLKSKDHYIKHIFYNFDYEKTNVSGSLAESSKKKKLRKFDYVTESGDHAHLTKEQINAQKKIEEEAKGEAAKQEREVKRAELVDLLEQKRLKSSVQYEDHPAGTLLNEPVLGMIMFNSYHRHDFVTIEDFKDFPNEMMRTVQEIFFRLHQGPRIDDHIVEVTEKATEDLIENNLKSCIAATIIEDRDAFCSEVPDLVSQEFNAQAPKIIEDIFKNYVQSNMKRSLQDSSYMIPTLVGGVKRKFEKSSTSNTSCRDDDIHSHHDDHQEDDAPPKGEKRVKRQKAFKVEKTVIDEDKVIPEDKKPELITELQDVDKRVPTIFNYERMKATLNDALSNHFKNAKEYAYHLEQTTNFMKNQIVWESRQEDIRRPVPRPVIFFGPQRNPNEPPKGVHDFQLGIESYQINLTAPTLTFPDEKRVMYLTKIVKFCDATLEKILKEMTQNVHNNLNSNIVAGIAGGTVYQDMYSRSQIRMKTINSLDNYQDGYRISLEVV
ncbi:hypothetical protein Tco_1176812 [Tanacetum coccineum]